MGHSGLLNRNDRLQGLSKHSPVDDLHDQNTAVDVYRFEVPHWLPQN
ncbi:hypothetical protein [Acinetobacter sp. ANC 4470]